MVGLWRPGGGASRFDQPPELIRELLHQLGMSGMEVSGLLGVRHQVVELDRGQLLLSRRPLGGGAPASGAPAEEQLPAPLAHREVPAAGVMDDHLVQGLGAPTFKDRDEAGAVFRHVIALDLPGGFGAGGHDVGQGDGVWVEGAPLHPPGPAHQEGDPVPAFEGVRLPAAEVLAQVHAGRLQLLEVALGRRAVVAGEEHQGVLAEVGPVQGVEELAHHRVRLDEEVGVFADLGPALEVAVGGDGGVG